MLPGRPSVDLVRQLVHICGTSCTHHRTVPMVPRTLAATGMEDCGAMAGGQFAYVNVCFERKNTRFLRVVGFAVSFSLFQSSDGLGQSHSRLLDAAGSQTCVRGPAACLRCQEAANGDERPRLRRLTKGSRAT